MRRAPAMPPTLRARAVAWLAQRDHSEQELRRKLARWLAEAERSPSAGHAPAVEPPVDGQALAIGPPAAAQQPPDDASPVARIDAVIAWLRERGYLDDERYARQRVAAREGRMGLARIRQELARQGVALPAEAAGALRESEFERARALWLRRYGGAPADAREAARQARFLIGRGFAAEVVRQVLRRAGAPDPDEAPEG